MLEAQWCELTMNQRPIPSALATGKPYVVIIMDEE
jgi:hypothetical protein